MACKNIDFAARLFGCLLSSNSWRPYLQPCSALAPSHAATDLKPLTRRRSDAPASRACSIGVFSPELLRVLRRSSGVLDCGHSPQQGHGLKAKRLLDIPTRFFGPRSCDLKGPVEHLPQTCSNGPLTSFIDVLARGLLEVSHQTSHQHPRMRWLV